MDSTATGTITVGAVSVDFLVDADDSGGSVTAFECAVPANAKVPVPHSHDGFEETIENLRGRAGVGECAVGGVGEDAEARLKELLGTG